MRALWVTLLVCLCLPVAAAAAPPQPGPYEGTANGRFFSIIPPGQAGVANAPQAADFLATGTRPAHFSDQRDLYTDLLYASPGLADDDISRFFPDASFGVAPGDVERTYSPRDDVTIVRDKSFGVPHVYGASRAAVSFGAGYAIAEDRLFFMDVIRNFGAGRLSQFAGGANVSTDRAQFENAPYTEADIQRQITQLPDLYGEVGQNLVDDVQAWCDGVNAYIAEARINPLKMPVEYGAVNQPQGPRDFTPADVVRAASLIGAELGKGGGNELTELGLLEASIKRFGGRRGIQMWQDFRGLNDPESPVTATRKRGFPYDEIPKDVLKTVARPDAGSFEPVQTQVGGAEGRSSGPFEGLIEFPKTASNALLVPARNSATGNPLAVFGAQTGYFQPQIWWGVELHGPGFDVGGATIPGTGPYVEIGRGPDYSWSATSASQDIVDVYALRTCKDDMHYRYRGACEAMEVIEQSQSWVPSAADQTPAGTATFRALRTKLGLVVGRARIDGKPVVYTKLRSTYGHEFDSGRGFQAFNDPDKIKSLAEFKEAAMGIGYTFNWLYTDDRDIGYINTGANPVRRKGVNGLLPIEYRRGREWKGFDPETNLATYQSQRARPQATNQRYIVSWNNQQARRCCGGKSFTPLYRSQLITEGLDERLRGGRKMTLGQAVDVAQDAATMDLRGDRVLPAALRVVGKPKDPALAAAVKTLRAWQRTDAHRIDRDKDGTYEDTEAVRIMDAWMTLLPEAVFRKRLGKATFDAYDKTLRPDIPNSRRGNTRDHLGSAWENGWYGYIQKDLRTVAAPGKVRGKYALRFCGSGKLSACRRTIRSSLTRALAIDPAALYADETIEPADCGAMDMQACFDSIRYRPLGLISQPLVPWQNRPTQQQVVEVTAHRPR
ncbi:MAG: penicillin acylase family protein [Solirubrobacteraceae bacterium]